jgi:Flp pilus assembly protein TadD
LAGCATPYAQGRAALRHERYDEALSHFSEALARDPGRLDARAGLGVARYKLGGFDEAEAALNQVLAQAPKHAEARFYLGLAHLQKGQNSAAEEQLTALLALEPHPRIAAQIDRALTVIRAGPLADEVKRFVAASLEDEVEWEQEVREAERAQRVYMLEPAGLIYWPYWYPRRYPLP